MASRYLRFKARSGQAPQRAPLLEKLLARADQVVLGRDWRADAYLALQPTAAMPGIAALLCNAAVSQAKAASIECGAWLCLASPLHYVAEMNNVRVDSGGILPWQPAEAAWLAEDFNRHWSDAEFHLQAHDGNLLCHCRRVLHATLSDPEQVAGRHLQEFLPAGKDAPALRLLMSELEMWLFDHPLNRARAARAEAAISGLWLWGGGERISSLPSTLGSAAGEDVFFNAFKAEGEGHENVMVLQEEPGTEAWRQLESRWLRPVLDALRRGVVSRLDVSCDHRCYQLGPGWRYRIFRKLKPWWEYFD